MKRNRNNGQSLREERNAKPKSFMQSTIDKVTGKKKKKKAKKKAKKKSK
jgi:hypothetical protein